MPELRAPRVAAIREFNRMYTRTIGLLDRYILNSPFSLTEARVLLEIGSVPQSTPTRLATSLGVDPGYLSRMLSRFEGQGLVCRQRNPRDARQTYLKLTVSGLETLTELSRSADCQVGGLLDGLPDGDQARLVECMQTIQKILGGQGGNGEDLVVRLHRPGDAGYVIHRHGALYAREYGLDHTFEKYVCSSFTEFLDNYDARRDRLWMAECNGMIVGSIGVVGRPENTAQLRWFLVEPDFRGRGLGRRLLGEALTFCRDRGFRSVFLWTFHALDAARYLYQGAGFRLTDREQHMIWGRSVVEERWELDLGS